MEELNDKELIEAARTDPAKFTDLYDRYVDRIYRYFLVRTSHIQTAEDLTSQTFLQAFEAFASYKLKTDNFGSWLFTIAHNLLVNNYKKKTPDLLSTDFDADAGIDVELDTDAKLAAELLKSMVDDLPERDREIIYLRVSSDLSFAQVAEILGINENAARTAYHRAVQKLISTYGDKEGYAYAG